MRRVVGLAKAMAGRQKALNYFWGEPWDYFELVITGTDRLHHYLWNAGQDPAHPYHENFIDFYRQVDRVIERVVNGLRQPDGREPVLYLLSDHGFTRLDLEVNLNAWLEREGYLSFSSASPKGLDEIAPGLDVGAFRDGQGAQHVERHPGERPRGVEVEVGGVPQRLDVGRS